MASGSLDIRGRIAGGTPLKTTTLYSPLARPSIRSPNKLNPAPTSLSLRTIIGTTSTSSSGLTCDYNSNTFAYCAGSAAVLAKVGLDGSLSYKFFRAHPNSGAIHPYNSFYSPSTPNGTPENRRRTIVPIRNRGDTKLGVGSPRRLWGDDGSSKTWSARERVKAVSCLHLSSNGRFLAVGETGYNPRVNIFSLIEGIPGDVPLSILTEHSFGIRNLAFSPDSKWLATLGDANDGFLFIWSINPRTGAAKLYQTNKCTAAVLDMSWCGSSLITVGTRHIKVWRVEPPPVNVRSRQGTPFSDRETNASPAPKTLPGRNCRLGTLADSTFTCVAPITDCEAVICTRAGMICVLDDRGGNQKLRCIMQLDFSISSAAVDIPGRKIWFANPGGYFQSEGFDRFCGLDDSMASSPSRQEVNSPPASHSSPSTPVSHSLGLLQTPPTSADRLRRRGDGILASKCLPGRIIAIDRDRKMRLTSVTDRGEVEKEGSSDLEITLPAHDEAVQGVIVVPQPEQLGDYVTWSLGGTVKFWSLDGAVKRVEKIELEQPERSLLEPDEYDNELKSLRISPDSQFMFVGDRHGVLQVINIKSWKVVGLRVHAAEITDIALSAEQDATLIATSSRDRTVQVLQSRDGDIDLLQTLDDHVGAVNSVAYMRDCLISASADRTVVIRQRISRSNDTGKASTAFIPSRVITLKASPTSMTFPDSEVLVVSTMDRQILTFNITTGVLIDGFKALDAEGEDAVVLNALTISSLRDGIGSRRILTSYSSTDKSIRVYDYDNGTLLARELGHTDGVSGITILNSGGDVNTDDKKVLISTGMDGLIMTWNIAPAPLRLPSTPLQEISQGQAMANQDSDATPTKDPILRRPPLRKVLSKVDLLDSAGFRPSASSRDPSPSRVKRKASRYTLATPKQNGLPVTPLKVLATEPDQQSPPAVEEESISPPPPVPSLRPYAGVQDSPRSAVPAEEPSAISDEKENETISPEKSPKTRVAPVSLPSTPKVATRPVKPRLKRLPSIPADLRNQSHTLTRRKSMGNVNEFGSIGMASEQICRTLQAYRKKIKAASKTDKLSLDEVEMELSATLRAVQERRDMKSNRRAKAATENDLEGAIGALTISKRS